MKKVFYSLLFACVYLQGCAIAPTDSSGRTLTVADAGPAPTDHEASFKASITGLLKDPESARYRNISKPTAQVVNTVPGFMTGGVGWSMCGEVNAKNTYGGYTGFQWWWVLVNQDTLVTYQTGDMATIICTKK